MINSEDETDTWLEETQFEADIPTETMSEEQLKSLDVSIHTQGSCPKHPGKHYMRDGKCPFCSGLVK